MWVLCDLGRCSRGTLPLPSARLQRHASNPHLPACTPLRGWGLGQPEDPSIWWLLTIPPLAPQASNLFDGVASHHRANLSEKMHLVFPQHSPIWSSRHCLAPLNTTSLFPLPLSKQPASLRAFHLGLSGVSQTALTVSAGLPGTHQALQELLLKCLSLVSKIKHLSPPLPTNKQMYYHISFSPNFFFWIISGNFNLSLSCSWMGKGPKIKISFLFF